MLLDNDVMADGEAQPGAFASRLGCKEGIEHLLLHLGRNTGAVVANPDLDAISQIFSQRGKLRLISATICLFLAPGGRIETV